MRKIYTLIICIICFQFIAIAQFPSVKWTKNYGNTNTEGILDAIQTNDNGFILVGLSRSNSGDVSGHHGSLDSADAWVVKVNADGVIQWQRSFGGSGVDYFNSIVKNADGNYVCLGATSSTNGDVVGYAGTGQPMLWGLKIDRFGNIVWSKCYNNDIYSKAMSMMDSSTIINYQNTLLKININGDVLWQTNDSTNNILISEDGVTGNLMITGKTATAYYEQQIDKNTGTILTANTVSFLNIYGNPALKYNNKYVCMFNECHTASSGFCTGSGLSDCSFSVVSPDFNSQLDGTYCGSHCGITAVATNCSFSTPIPLYNDSTFLITEWTSTVNYCSSTYPYPVYYNNITKIFEKGYYGLGVIASTNVPLSKPKFFRNTKTLISLNSTSFGYVFGLTVYKPMYRNVVKGTMFLDKNSNGVKEVTEPYFDNATVMTYDSSNSIATTANSYNYGGSFFNEVGAGVFRTKVKLYRPYYKSIPNYLTSIFNAGGAVDSINFAIQPIPNKNDLQINAFAVNTARPGFDIDYNIQYSNQGTTTLSGEVRFVKEHNLTYITANPLPSSISGDTLIWNYTNFPMDSSATINVKFNIPTTFSIHDVIQNSTTIYPVIGDETPINNTATMWQELRGSYDPNDKNEIHNGKYTLTDLGNKEVLLYTIRFQNTGNDTAFTVEVKDTLDSKLDINSFEMVSASHNYKLSIVDNKYCTWTFNNILLVDSNHNEAASHGYISYRIVPKTTVVHNDVINNSASIYFDYNLPIQTNIQKTTIINTALPVRLLSFTGKQNNKTAVLNWQSANEINMDKYIVEKSVDGSKYNALGNVNATNKDNSLYQFTDGQPSKLVNYYRLKMIESNGKYSYSNIVVITFKNNSSINVYPNPTKDNLTIESKAVKTVVITDCFGRTILQLNNITERQTINTKQWNKGIYIVSFDNGEKVKVVKE